MRGLDPNALLQHYHGSIYYVLFAILFCETGLVVIPFLPGDTLLFTAGLFSRTDVGSKDGLNIWMVLLVMTIAPICGDNLNYFFGYWLGPKLFKNPKSKIFKKENLEKTHEFYVKYGPKAVMLARWVPIVRTFSPFVAGMGSMPYRVFLTYSVAGACLWVWTLTLAGFLLGREPWIHDNLILVMVVMMLVTGGPIIVEILRARKSSNSKSKDEKPSEPVG